MRHLDIQFIYDLVESNYSNLECYSIYDFTENSLVYDVKLNKSLVMIDRNNKLVYLMHMETEDHWILEKNYFRKIIEIFINEMDKFDCKDYVICEDCSGGKIYYKYN